MEAVEPHGIAGAQPYPVRTACPCCEAPVDAAMPSMRSYPAAEELDIAEHGRFLSGYDSGRIFFSYRRCGRCTALFCPAYYSSAQLRQLYGRQSENMEELPLAARIRTQEGYARLAMKHGHAARGYLELGADIGIFASACAKAGRFDHFHLYEPNRNIAEQLAARMAGRPYTLRREDFRADHVPKESVSLAAMIHVLDHLIEPAQVLSELRQALTPDGTLFIVTHNVDSLFAKVLGRRWPPYTLQHPQLFSPTSIRTLLARAGYAVISIAASRNYFPLPFLTNAALRMVGLPNLLADRDGINVPLRLGNIATLARKR